MKVVVSFIISTGKLFVVKITIILYTTLIKHKPL